MSEPNPNTPTILDCGHPSTPHIVNGTGSLGYGVDRTTGRTLCYACCGELDRQQMITEGRITLYLSGTKCWNGWGTPPDDPELMKITNWPGTLRFVIAGPTAVHKGRHNIARTRTDVWFRGPDSSGHNTATWHGVQYGDNTQLIHCKRVKS